MSQGQGNERGPPGHARSAGRDGDGNISVGSKPSEDAEVDIDPQTLSPFQKWVYYKLKEIEEQL